MYSGGSGLSIDIHFVDIELSYDVLSPLPTLLSKHFNHPHPYIEIVTAISDKIKIKISLECSTYVRKFTGLYPQMYKSYKYYKSLLICISEWILPLEGWFCQKWSHIMHYLYIDYIRDCGSNLYVGMGVVESTIGKGERTS